MILKFCFTSVGEVGIICRWLTNFLFEKGKEMRKRKRSGFTLTELVVVILILVMLAALIIPAVMRAKDKAYEAAQSAELAMMATQMESFKNLFGTYPPSRIVLSETGNYAGVNPVLANRSIQFFRTMFPRLPLSTYANTGSWDWNQNGIVDKPYEIDGAECLVFFLGGIPQQVGDKWGLTGFAKNPTNPLVGSNRNAPIFEFNAGRLTDLDKDGFPEYLDYNQQQPIVYFLSYGGNYDPDDVNYSEISDDLLTKQTAGAFFNQALIASPAPNPYTVAPPIASLTTGHVAPIGQQPSQVWWKPQTFQLICAGDDGLFGIGGQFVEKGNTVLPEYTTATADVTGQNPLPGIRQRERDNLTNFYGSRLD